MARSMCACALVGAAALLGCETYSSAGDGTHTLQIQGTLAYDADTPGPHTAVAVDLARVAGAASGATIRLIDLDSDAQVVLAESETLGHYALDWPGYHRRVRLEVEAGEDNLYCQIEGPGRHTVAAPQPGEVAAIDREVELNWATVDGVRADEVMVEVAGQVPYLKRLADDAGSFPLPPATLAAGAQHVTVTRQNRVVPLGGAGHSLVTSSYRVGLDFVAQ